MMKTGSFERRHFIKSAAFGLITVTAFTKAAAFGFVNNEDEQDTEPLFYRYPAMNDNMVRTIVGLSHSNFDKVKEMLTSRPELATAAWDWGFGDWETALGAASHVGRRDIAELLMSHGARPDIFTFAMLGMLKSVQEMVETIPGIQTKPGPHGITLLQHAKNRLTDKNISTTDQSKVNELINYLQTLGNADTKTTSIEISDEEKQKYIGEYRFGAGENEIFVVDLTSRKTLKIGRKGTFGSNLHKTGDHTFSPTGAPSVKIIFNMEGNQAASLGIHEHEPIVTANRM